MKRFLAAFAATLLALLSSCKNSPNAPSDDMGVRAIQFQDVVVPAGMTLKVDQHQSASVEEGGWRYGDFTYTGLGRVEDATAYVLERMPQHAWELKADETPDRFTRRLLFTRGRYRADYTIRRTEGITLMTVQYRTDVPGR